MKKTLLLVDNEVNILHALTRVFEDDEYSILTATSAKEGLEILSNHPVQVVISDYNMPVMTGSEFLKQVKALYPETVRIILSAYSDFNILREALNEGYIYKFLSKPWDENILRKQVEEAFLINAQQKEKEDLLIRRMNYSKLMALTTNKSTLSSVTIKELEEALELQQFVIYYQPIVDIDTKKIVAAEALLRWNHPTRGLLMPGEFITYCEEVELILPIGAWVLRSACQQLLSWHALGHTKLSIAVNLSTRQFEDNGLLELVEDILMSTLLPPSCLELEITETLLMSNIEANSVVLQRLRKLGIKLALDDFGTGYSSLNYLNRFPIDILKIDKSFIDDIVTDKSSLEIVTLIIALAKNLGLRVIAEGVEKQEQLTVLQQKNCDYIQGYLISKPIPKADFEQLLQAGHDTVK